MPYAHEIEREDARIELHSLLTHQKDILNLKKGQVTYLITMIVHAYLQGQPIKNYENISNAGSCFKDAHDEWLEQIQRPYERKKKAENGPISSLDAEVAQCPSPKKS